MEKRRVMPLREQKVQRKRTVEYLAIVLMVINIVFLLKIQREINRIDDTLGQVLGRLSVVRSEDGTKVPIQNMLSNMENDQRIQAVEMDYVSMCGLPEVEAPVKRSASEVLERLKELAEDSEMIADIYKKRSSYPDKMLEALANNPEMADFVSRYLASDAKATGDGFTETEKKQDYPLFLQWDPRWGYAEYGDGSNIGLAGCGPTCLSMVLYYLLENETLTPDNIAAYSMENGYYMSGTGTAWTLLSDVPALYGVSVSQPEKSERVMENALDKGYILICSMKAGDFTAAGHFIVIYGYDSKGFKVNDPNCVARSRKQWTYEEIGSQIKHLWVYSS